MPLFGSVAAISEKALETVPFDGGSVPGPCGGVDGPRKISRARVEGLTGRWRSGSALVRAVVLMFGEECGGKKMVAACARWQVA